MKSLPPSSAVSRPPRTAMADAVRRFARWRVPLGFAFAVVVLWLAAPTATSLLTGGVIAGLGETLRMWAAGHLHKSREVTASGPYRWLAHPLYVGSSIMGLGLALASNSAIVFVLIAAYLASTIAAAIKTEEAFLRTQFGERYDAYQRGRSDATRRFSLQQAIANREYRALAGLILAVLLLLAKATYNGSFWRAGPVR